MALTGVGSYVAFRISGAQFQTKTEEQLAGAIGDIGTLSNELAEIRGFTKSLDPSLGDRVGTMQQEVAGLKVIGESIGPLQTEINELSKMIHQMYGVYMRDRGVKIDDSR